MALLIGLCQILCDNGLYIRPIILLYLYNRAMISLIVYNIDEINVGYLLC